MDNTYSPLKSIPNFRDVGVIINEQVGFEILKPGRLYRGARPDEASHQDRQRLLSDYKIRTIIDLRTKTEHIEQAQKRDAKIKSSEAIPQTNDEVAEPLKIPGIQYQEINFNGSAFSRMLISKLSWVEFFHLIFLMAFGYRLDGIKILAPHMEEMGLTGLATSSVDVCTQEVRQFFDILADEENWPVLVHCTQGKDRTGLTVMLVLFLLGIELPAIEHDYLMSGPELEPERAERIREMGKIGLSEAFANVPAGLVAEVEGHISRKYGGIKGYLEAAGIDEHIRAAVKSKLLGP